MEIYMENLHEEMKSTRKGSYVGKHSNFFKNINDP